MHADHPHGANAVFFKWALLVRLISWPAHVSRAQQGRLQRRQSVPLFGLAHRSRVFAHDPQYHQTHSRPLHKNRCPLRRASKSSCKTLDSHGKDPCIKQNRPIEVSGVASPLRTLVRLDLPLSNDMGGYESMTGGYVAQLMHPVPNGKNNPSD